MARELFPDRGGRCDTVLVMRGLSFTSLLVVLLAVPSSGCLDTQGSTGGEAPGPTGSLALTLELGGEANVDGVTYSIRRDDVVEHEGTIDTSAARATALRVSSASAFGPMGAWSASRSGELAATSRIAPSSRSAPGHGREGHRAAGTDRCRSRSSVRMGELFVLRAAVRDACVRGPIGGGSGHGRNDHRRLDSAPDWEVHRT